MQTMRSSLSGYSPIWINTKMQLLYIHDKGLGDNQPIFSRMTPNSRALFIWDDAYFKKRNYSLKRLVFIYETLTTMPVEIVHGKTLDIVKEIAPKKVITPYTSDLELRRLIREILKILSSNSYILMHLYISMIILISHVFLNIGTKQKKQLFRLTPNNKIKQI